MNLENLMLSEISQTQEGRYYRRDLGESDSQRQKVERWLPGPGRRENRELLFCKMKSSGNGLPSSANTLNDIELHT